MHQSHQRISEVLEQAWIRKDIKLLSGVLADVLDWHEDTFDEPITTKQAVLDRWQIDLEKQSDIQVRVTLLDDVDTRSYHRCTARWQDDISKIHEIDALFVITLDETGKITSFLPWYANKP